MELLGDVGHVEPHFHIIGDSASVGARYMVCAEHTIDSENILDEHDGTAR
jgi:hypothetical protein